MRDLRHGVLVNDEVPIADKSGYRQVESWPTFQGLMHGVVADAEAEIVFKTTDEILADRVQFQDFVMQIAAGHFSRPWPLDVEITNRHGDDCEQGLVRVTLRPSDMRS